MSGGTPARRASLLMLIVAVLLCVLGGFLVMLAHSLAVGPIPPELAHQIHLVEAQTHEPFAVFLKAAYVTMFIAGFIFGVMGTWVRRGKLLPAVLALIVDGGAILVIGMSLLGGIVPIFSGRGNDRLLGSLTIYFIALALSVVLFKWLLQAARLARRRDESFAQPGVAAILGGQTSSLGYSPYMPPPPLPRQRD